MAVKENKESCNSCLFFVLGERMGICKRFPVAVNKSNDDWCGEHTPPKNAVFEAMSYTMTVGKGLTTEPVKKRGRPAKK